ncbi:hypothetical protein M408DRAFT_27201 [Serendipita vermifera MAFF 305830]|uniref:Uncharacterized protein n=1 Tax=Serendipita vermifera MAFF 305830 TaxID=933852 RepID=A0A0C2WCP1_SERVB|nr:hypothetical protein M408DRAFT_27201 [Serendipita vermifera MAFF 305830]
MSLPATGANHNEAPIQVLDQIATENNLVEVLKPKFDETHPIGDSRADLHCFHDPIEYFPPEIWIEIFMNIGFPDKMDDYFNPTDNLLVATLVSVAWRDAVLNLPELWTHVSINSQAALWTDDMLKLHMALGLSMGQLIHLRIMPSSTGSYESVLATLSTHSNRIKSISFEGFWNLGGSSFSKNLFQAMLNIGELSNLRVVQVTKKIAWNHLNWTIFLSNAPLLESTNLIIPLELLKEGRLSSCRSIGVGYHNLELAPLLGQFRCLKSLLWSAVPLYREPSNGRAQEILPTHVEELEELKFYALDRRTLRSIASFALKLRSLDVVVHWGEIGELLDACTLMPYLRTLELSIEQPEPVVVASPTRLLQIKTLVIKYDPIRINYLSGLLPAGPQLATLFDVFESCAPFVTDLYFHTGPQAYIPFEYISSLASLDRLTLSVPKLTSISHDVLIESRSLISISINIDARLISTFFQRVRAPELRRIVFLYGIRDDRSLEYPVVAFESSTFPMVSSIEWSNKPLIWKVGNLLSLQKISLRGLTRDGVTNLCVQFVIQPHNCPLLEHIEFGQLPEWDWLFIMLERRNYSNLHGVLRIKSLTFRTAVPSELLRPLTHLLAGRLTLRPSNQELSVNGIRQLYFNVNVTGCQSCLWSMRACPHPIQLVQKSRFVPDLRPRKFLRPTLSINSVIDPPLAPEIAQWLEGRSARYQAWDDEELGWRKQYLRSYSCNNTLIKRPMRVTEFTLAGTFHFEPMIVANE